MPLTLVQFWQAERETHVAARAAAQGELAKAQQTLLSAKSKLEADAATLNKLNADIAANRAKLPTTPVPSELTALNTVIRDQLNKQRALQGHILDGQDATAAAQAEVAAATSTLNRIGGRLSISTAAFEAATTAEKKRNTLKTQLASATIMSLQTDATAAAAGAMASDAKAEIDASFPAELQAVAAKRYASRATREMQLRQSVKAAELAHGASLATNNGLEGKAAKEAIAFQHAERALREYANNARQRYDRAVAVLTGLQALNNGTSTPHLLSVQEKVDVAVNAGRTAAGTEAEGVDTARSAVSTAQNEVDTQILTQIATDVDKLPTDATVKAKRDAVIAKSAALKAAQDALDTGGERKTMDDWQIVVQDKAWQALVDYLEAGTVLAELKSTAPASLGTSLDVAEDAYATALAAAAKAQRQADALMDVIVQRTERATATTAALPVRLLSAVRGDSY